MTGREVYDNFKQGIGARTLTVGADQLRALATNYKDRADSITALTMKMEAAWQGDAAGAARRGAGPLAVEHGLAAPDINIAQDSLTNQVSAFNTANNSVVPVPDEPKKPGIWDNITSLGGASDTYERKRSQYNAANDHNVSIMTTYEDQTTQNGARMPTSYGSIEPDYSAVGVTPTQSPSTTPGHRVAPPQPGGPDQGTGGQPPGGRLSPPNDSNNGGSNLTHSGPVNPGQPSQGTGPDQFVAGPGQPGPGGPGTPGTGPGTGGSGPAPGFLPGPGFGPNGGGGPNAGRGPGGGRGFGPGGSGPGGGGFGEDGGRGPGGRGGAAGGFGGEEGGRLGRGSGAGFGAGGAAAAEAAASARGAGAGGRGGPGGMPMGGGGRGQGSDDDEHQRPSFLVEADPDETFGTDEVTAPPVIGE